MTAETEKDLPPWDRTVANAHTLFMGNHDALRVMEIIGTWTHLYDDLIDADKEIDPEFIHKVMWEIMVELSSNKFYTTYAHMLSPVIATGILNWRGANDMEKSGSKEELYISHATRYSINDLALLIMTILGGPGYAAHYARDARLVFQRDTLSHYLAEHGHE